jgi:hypothetical protein
MDGHDILFITSNYRDDALYYNVIIKFLLQNNSVSYLKQQYYY